MDMSDMSDMGMDGKRELSFIGREKVFRGNRKVEGHTIATWPDPS